MSAPTTDRTLTDRVISGGAWGVLGTGVQALLGVAASIVVARHLAPTDYAIMALAGAVMRLAAQLGQFGLAESVVRERDDPRALAGAVFWAALALGLILSAGILLLTPLLVALYDQPQLAAVLPVLSGALVAGFVAAPARALLQREQRYGALNVIRVGQATVGAALAIALAIMGAGYWALVLPGAAVALFTLLPTYALAQFLPKAPAGWSRLRENARFGSGVFLARLLNNLSGDLDYLVLGRTLPAREFGLYYFAFTRAQMPYVYLAPSAQEPLFAAFSIVERDRERLGRAVERVAAFHFWIFAPLALAIAVLADPLLPLLFGEGWRAAIPATRAFALMGLLPAAGGFTGSVMLASGRPWLMAGLNTGRLVLLALALTFCVASGLSMNQTAAVVAGVTAATLAAHLAVLFHVTGLGYRTGWRVYGPTSCSLALAAAGSFLMLRGAAERGAALRLALAAATFGGLFLATSLAWNRPILREVSDWLLGRWRSIRAARQMP